MGLPRSGEVQPDDLNFAVCRRQRRLRARTQGVDDWGGDTAPAITTDSLPKTEKDIMPDEPFDRAAKIRRGECDDEMPAYDELTGWLQRVPITWLPGLLVRTVELCVIRKVFQGNGLKTVVSRAKAKATMYPGSVLRSTQETEEDR